MSAGDVGMGSIGYARVSTLEQNADLQHAALKAAGCTRIFTDHGVSGTRASRPELDKLLDHLRAGDEVVVWKLDRLGRNTRNLLALIDDLEHRKVHFRSVTEGISTTGPMGRAMLTVMSAFAQLERDQLAERTRAGMAIAAEHGRKAGRREVTADHAKVRRAHELKAQGLAPADIGKIIGASRATVYRYLGLAADRAE
ncbi:recombinase family protein [Arthrobacter sp. CAN_C5]|uniref:recombinase family protein n=1 Tax=Arthrobacter sp. CAN_C5 TaxID=2760706 RepID=UPI0028AD79CC|nr:recombinase family protein [Arthrobacter sp. CAN_C5]MBP2215071.1 DNA invertase Pin-like site-specific DNA recombinase [Arthrobacter sp. CAN_C5]